MPGLDRSSLVTADPEAAREAFAPLVPRLQFGRVDPDVFRMWIRSESTGSFSLFNYAFAAPTAVDAGADEILVVNARGRGLEVRHGRAPIDTSRPYVNVAEGISATWDVFAARAVMLSRSKLHDVARMVTGESDVRLELTDLAARSMSLGLHWDSMVDRVTNAMAAAPEAFEEPIVAEAAFHRLAVTYLNVFHLAWAGPDGRQVPVGARSAVVRAALEYLHANAALPITVQHVADAVHISTRGLHAAFVGETGRSPSDHLRAIRLQGVRDELRFAAPVDTIAVIARRWGFVHLPRFAEAYERAFGELPSATRGRRRQSAA